MEYKIIDLSGLKLKDMDLQLNLMSKEGWRVITNLGSTLLIFGREIKSVKSEEN